MNCEYCGASKSGLTDIHTYNICSGINVPKIDLCNQCADKNYYHKPSNFPMAGELKLLVNKGI
jgi:protein-arginine kinase activator protein McsA